MKGSVRKKPDGRWEGRVELPRDPITGKRKQKYVYGKKKAECQRKVNALILDIESGDFTNSGRLTVNKYMEEWFEVHKDKLEESTQVGYKNYVHKHIMPYFKDKKLKDLKPIDAEKFYNHEREKGYSEKTILQVHRIFSKGLKAAAKNKLISSNPCALIDAPSPADFEINVPEVDLFWDMVVAAVGTEHEIPILLAGLCGLRRSEVFGLTYNDIDFENATLTVRQVKVMAGKKINDKGPKSKESKRTISIPGDLLKILKENKKVGYVASVDGNLTHPGNYSDRYARFLRNNKLPHIRFHDLRHFHATLLLDAGIDIKLAQARMGHASINQTAYYQHIRRKPKADFEVVKQMDEYLKKSPVGQKVGQGQNEGVDKTGGSV